MTGKTKILACGALNRTTNYNTRTLVDKSNALPRVYL